MKNRFPNVIVGGAPKCGTSSLYYWLSAHPEVYGSPQKETYFYSDQLNKFNQELNWRTHGEASYLRYFEGAGDQLVRFEATARYLYDEKALETFSKKEVPPKMIFLFREPSKMLQSHYKMVRYRTKNTQKSLEEYSKGAQIREYVNYSKYLKRWLEVMPEGHVGVWMFEDMMSRKVEVMQEIAAFVGIDPNFYNTFDFEHRNESVAIRSSFLHELGLKLQPLIPHALQKLVLPLYLKLNSGGRVSDVGTDQQTLANFKAEHSFVGSELKALLPDFPLEKWG
jgi:hypothetical protein